MKFTHIKNIVFIIESLNLGGAETSLVTFLNNIDFSKYKVDLILFVKDNFFIKYVPDEVNIIYINFPNLSLIDRLNYKSKKIFNINKWHNAQILFPIITSKLSTFNKKYDIAHAYNQGFATYYTANFISANKKFAWINIDYQMAKYNINFDIHFYQKFNRVIAISQEVERGFLEEVDKTKTKLHTSIIKLFADDLILKKRSTETLEVQFKPYEINIVTACRLSKQKGLHLAVESCRKLLDKGYKIHWYIVGEGSERSFLEKLILQNKLSNNFTLLGKKINPFPYMNACDIYVQTSLFEGWGLTLIEAVLLNKFVVTTNFPTAYDIVKNNETGLICEMNSDSLVEGIEKFINDKNFKDDVKYNLSIRENIDKDEALAELEKISE
jgi:glycosyltransferase involved in cell wall biosynthesis